MRSPEEGGVKKYIVRLSRDEREHLCELLKKGKSSAKVQLKARILLKANGTYLVSIPKQAFSAMGVDKSIG